MPVRVSGKFGVDVARHEPEVGRRKLPLLRRALRIAQRLQLFEMRELAYVDLLREVPPDRFLERVALIEVATREGPTPLEWCARPLPEQRLQLAVPHLEDHGQCHMGGRRVPRVSLRHSFRPIVVNLSGKVRNEEIAPTD